MPCCRRESCPRVEAQRLAREVPSPSPPVSRLLRLHLLRAASGLALPVSPRGFAGTPPWPYAPPRLPWRRLVHSFPFPPPSPGVPRPPRWEPARSGRGRAPMNSGVPATLAVRRVKFFGRHGGEVNSSAFSPDGQMLLTGSEDGCVYGWETRSGQLLWRLGGHTGPVKFCRFSPDGHLFASASCDCTVRLWDVARAKCLQVLKGHQRSVETVSFSPDSRQLASGGWDKRVMLWEVQSGQMLRLLVGHRDSVQSSDFSPTVNCLATGSWDSTIRIWDLRTGTPAVSHQALEGHSGNISCLCYSASGLLVSGCPGFQGGPLLAARPLRLPGPKPQGSELSAVQASGSWDKTIHIWKPTTSSLLIQLKGHVTWVKSVAFSPDELWLASAGYSRMVTTPGLSRSYPPTLPPPGALSTHSRRPTSPLALARRGQGQDPGASLST
uniref:WD repeat domain 38 n=1 Tax=Papio anubis TaxID=9555 RepID=A0A8I5NYS0_PAPAN